MSAQPNYGKRLLINLVDELALCDPERIVYSIAHSQDIAQGFRHVSARDFANAVNRTSWWLKSELGEGVSFPSIGYIGPCRFMLGPVSHFWPCSTDKHAAGCDFRYILLILGCVKAGYKVRTRIKMLALFARR